MKSYEQMAENVFKRREQYRINVKKRRNSILTAACCICLCCLLGVGGYMGGLFEEEQLTTQTRSDAPASSHDQTNTDAPISSKEEERVALYINELTAKQAEEAFKTVSHLNLSEDIFHPMSRDQMQSYLGVQFDLAFAFPELSEREDASYGYYQFADGYIWDQQDFTYYDREGHSANIVVRKGEMPFFCFTDSYLSKLEAFMIDDIEVRAVHYRLEETDIYYAEFFKDGVGFTVHCDHLPRKTFISIVRHLAEG